MQQDELFQLGKVVKTFGSKGEVIFFLDTDTPERYKKLESVFIRIKGNLIPFFIESFELKTKNQAVVKIEDIDDTEDASLLVGGELMLPIELLPRLKGNKFYYHEVEGYKVTDHEAGDIGTVAHVLDLEHQSLLQIDFMGKEILVPVIDEIIKKVDRRNKTIFIEAPEGLIALYLGEQEL